MESSEAGSNQAYSNRPVNAERLAAIESFAGRKVLDVGCGNGAYVLNLASRYDISGVDCQHFESWKSKPELFNISDAEKLDADDDSVDTVLAFELLEHLQNPGDAIREYYRVCRKNLILSVPNCELTVGMRKSGIIYNHWIDRTHINFWNMDSIADLVIAAGFDVKHRQYINHLNMGHAVAEALGFSGKFALYFAGLFRWLQRGKYPMTCLIVAEKI